METKPIPGYEDYTIDRRGKVFSTYTHEHITPLPSEQGKYKSVILFSEGRRKQFQVRELVANAYLFEEAGKTKLMNLDGDTQNDCANNLKRCTPWEYRQWRKAINEQANIYTPKQGRALDEFQVRDIRYLREKFNWDFQGLADRFEVSVNTIKSIIDRKTWVDLE